MNESRPFQAQASTLLVALLVASWGCGREEPVGSPESALPPSPPPARGQPASSDEFFTNWPVPRLVITIAGTNLDLLEKENRTYVQATVQDGSLILTNAGIHLKGSPRGSFRPLEDKPALTVNSDKFVDDQKYHGMDKFYLNNSVEDGSYIAEHLCNWLFREAGVPAPRVTHARVELNGRDRGLYVLKEGFDRTFLRRCFANPEGDLYDGGLVTDITEPLKKNAGDDATGQPELMALVEAAQEPDLARRWERMQRLLDLDRFMSFMALEILISHTDGYCLNRNNYRVYHDPVADKLIFIPHGLDIVFTIADLPLYPPMEGLVARALMEIPEARRQYMARVTELIRTVLRLDRLTGRIYALQERLRPVIAQMGEQALKEHDMAVEGLRLRVAQRLQHLEEVLQVGETNLLTFNQQGVAELSGWVPEIDYGNHLLEEVTVDGKPALHIQAGSDGNCTASWRAAVRLKPGTYRLEGKARCVGVVPLSDEKGQGAGLRISGSAEPRDNGLSGDAPWSDLVYPFKVDPGAVSREVELVCELRGQEGEVWFDAGSLRLVRLSP